MRSNDLLLFEFAPNRTAFNQVLQDATIKMGFECEMVTPVAKRAEREEPDWDQMSWDELRMHDEIYIPERMESRLEHRFDAWRENKAREELQDWWDDEDNRRRYIIDWMIQNDHAKSADEENIDELVDQYASQAHTQYMEEELPGAIENAGDMDDFIEDYYGSNSEMLERFGVSWSNDEEGERDPQDVYEEMASELEGVINKTVNVNGSYHSREKNPEDWYIEEDGSLEGDGYICAEVVSCVYPIKAGLGALGDTFHWMMDNGYRTNSSTGLHVSFSIEGKSAWDFDKLKMMVLFDENYTAKLFDRLNAYYAKNLRSILFGKFAEQGDPTTMMTSRQIGEAIDALHKITAKIKIDSDYFGSAKYFSFRHRGKGVFEFRSMGGNDYEHKFETIRKRIVNMAYLMKVGSDPKMMAREYISRVYKLLNVGKYAKAELGSGQQKIPDVPIMLSSFKSVFAANPVLLQQASSEPYRFLFNILTLYRSKRLEFTRERLRQLRFYVASKKISADGFRDSLRGKDDVYNALASLLRWPLVVPGEHDSRQMTMPYARYGSDMSGVTKPDTRPPHPGDSIINDPDRPHRPGSIPMHD